MIFDGEPVIMPDDNQLLTDHIRLHAVVHGRVQGVGFRAYTQKEAVKLGLTGYVRNLSDGSVEVEAEGSKSNLTLFVKALKTGPSGSDVELVSSTWHDATKEFSGFHIRYFG